jgi:High potential iron-sulfur protein
MKQSFSRRALAKGLIAGAMIPALGLVARTVFAQNVSLDPNDPTAKALGYITSSTIPEKNCANCSQYKGAAGASKGGCTIFPGKDVTAAGYCTAWVKKP